MISYHGSRHVSNVFILVNTQNNPIVLVFIKTETLGDSDAELSDQMLISYRPQYK